MVVCSNANNEEDQIDEHDGSNKNYQDRKPLQPGANTKMTISYQHNARTRNTHTRVHTQYTHARTHAIHTRARTRNTHTRAHTQNVRKTHTRAHARSPKRKFVEQGSIWFYCWNKLVLESPFFETKPYILANGSTTQQNITLLSSPDRVQRVCC